jgi:uncharacterized protein YacL
MKNIIIQRFITVIIIIIIFLIIFQIGYRKKTNYLNDFYHEYPTIDISKAVNARVIGIANVNTNVVRDSKIDVFITTDDSMKYHILVLPVYKGPNIQDVVKVGSIVQKKQGEREIEVLNIVGFDTTKFEFELP